MRNRLIYIALFALVMFSNDVIGQQDPMYTHYMFNTLAVNSGYAGSREALTVTALTRHQWVGFDGAPNTQTLTVHSPLAHEKLGVGLSIVHDKIGPVGVTSFFADGAYRFQVSQKAKLALGLKAGINLMQASLTSLVLDEQGDQTFQSNIKSDVLPNLGFGAYYYTDNFYAGLSAPKLLENDFETNTVTGTTQLASEKRHYFAIIGAVFKLSDDLKLKPTSLVKVVQNAPVEFDFTANFLIREKLSLGAMYRTRDGLGALIGYQFNDQLRAGYAYDFPLTEINQYSIGSHELMLSYDFFFNDKGRIKSPRYF
ncbi:MAG: type IX secretion system membrane protein PorP/SprF [Flavobacteriales bacterium]|nr:type IX secretion system membrane protein PorP/SprF [Flavobacteriales bacterium]